MQFVQCILSLPFYIWKETRAISLHFSESINRKKEPLAIANKRLICYSNTNSSEALTGPLFWLYSQLLHQIWTIWSNCLCCKRQIINSWFYIEDCNTRNQLKTGRSSTRVLMIIIEQAVIPLWINITYLHVSPSSRIRLFSLLIKLKFSDRYD